MFTTRILLVLSIVGADLLLMAFPENTSENRCSFSNFEVISLKEVLEIFALFCANVGHPCVRGRRDFEGEKQSCESRRQTNSMSSRPRFREIWKVSLLSRSLPRPLPRSLPLSGKKVSPRSRPGSSFSRPPHAENETSIAVRGSRLPPPTPSPFLYFL